LVVKQKTIYVTLMLLALSAPAVAQGFEPGTMPPREIMRMLRSTGFEPMSRPMRRGPNYLVFAIDSRDREVQLVIGAHTGAIVSVTPMQTASRIPPPRGGVSMGPYERVPPGYVPPAGYRSGSIYEDDDDAPPAGPYGVRPPAPVPGVPPRVGNAAPPYPGNAGPPAPRVGSVMPQDDDESLPPRSWPSLPPRSGPAVIPADPDRSGFLPPPPERFPQRASPVTPDKPKPVKRAAAPPKQAPLPKSKPDAKPDAKAEAKPSGNVEASSPAKTPPPQSWPGSKPDEAPLPN
jgi:hypothetical protein